MRIYKKAFMASASFGVRARKVEFTEHDLHAGHHAPVVAASVLYPVGSMNEAPSRANKPREQR